MADQDIALYTCDGEWLQMIDATRLSRLVGLGRIASVVRRRKGQPVRASLLRMPGDTKPSSLRDYTGTKYSFQQHLNEGNRCFRLRSLGDDPHNEVELAPVGVRAIFLRVVTDCLTTV
jgi:hypothetical protein